MHSIRVLLRGSIDYAGLFPPASLDLSAAAANYARYRTGGAAWALGRFVLPANRLAELDSVAGAGWRFSALLGPEQGEELQRVSAFNARHAVPGAVPLRVDTLELKATSVGIIEQTMDQVPDGLEVYFEVPIDRDPGEWVEAIARRGARAKVRTGGVTPQAFPTSSGLVRFIQACIAARVPFKATAGLHHFLRADYRLTYAPDSPSGTMFGFLNVFAASALLREGVDRGVAVRVLEESSLQAFQIDDLGLGWGGHVLDLDALEKTRQEVFTSFGSCSFTEPIGELESLGLLQPKEQQA